MANVPDPDRERFEAWFKERTVWAVGSDQHYWAAQGWQEAVRQEREACLTICAELHEHYSGYKDTALLNGDVELSNAASGEPRACEAIAAAIRARSEQGSNG